MATNPIKRLEMINSAGYHRQNLVFLMPVPYKNQYQFQPGVIDLKSHPGIQTPFGSDRIRPQTKRSVKLHRKLI
jgi:hypothetical protein